MKTHIVLGTGFGDEGKGHVTDLLCDKILDWYANSKPLVVRFSGGHQAGHTVIANGLKHTFSSFGAGTLRGVPTYWSEFCTFDPVNFMNEYNALKDKGIEPVIYLNAHAPVTTPFDKTSNDKTLAIKHGTCGLGVGDTFQRQEDFYRLTVGDLLNDFMFREKYRRVREYYQKKGLHALYEPFMTAVEEVKKLRQTSSLEIVFDERFIEEEFNYVIFEGSQGILLDQHIGIFPHVTRSHTSSKNAMQIIKRNDLPKPEMHYVTRTYQTRHGNGPMTNEDIPFEGIDDNPNEINVENKYQGKFRKALLDIDLLRHAINMDSLYHQGSYATLHITCLDLLSQDGIMPYTEGGVVGSIKTTQTEFSRLFPNMFIELHRSP